MRRVRGLQRIISVARRIDVARSLQGWHFCSVPRLGGHAEVGDLTRAVRSARNRITLAHQGENSVRYNASECWGLTEAQLLDFYRIERSLANRLMVAPRAERLKLYGQVYDELFSRVPYHPMLVRKRSSLQQASDVAIQMSFLRRFVRSDMSVLEIGAGDCAVSVELARIAKVVYALDVSDVITGTANMPNNLKLILSDGISVPLPCKSVDVAYSNQLMEHLHPEDAREQLANIVTVLKPGGRYICVTPSRLGGPNDVSRFFDDTATCFHLREYTYSELSDLFRESGFDRVEAYLGHRVKGIYLRLPLAAIRFFEGRAEGMTRFCSYEDRQRIMDRLPYRQLRDIRIAGIK